MKRIQIKNELSVSIKRQTQTWWLMWVIILLPMVKAVLIEFLHIPAAMEHVQDVVWTVLLIYVLCSPSALRMKRTAPMLLWIFLFFVYTLVVYLFRFQSPLYYLWGVRNNFRFYVAFFAFCVFLNSEDAADYLDLMDKLFWLNLMITLIQYVMGYRNDFLGGIFGTTVGCNGYSNVFMLIVVTKSLIYCFNKKESLLVCMLKCFTALLIAALAELKFFFVEFLFVAALVFCMTRFSVRKVLIIAAAVVGVLAGIAILTQLYPYFRDAFSPKNFIDIAASKKGYTNKGDFNRLTAISCANEQFLRNTVDRLFGLGLGNCDTASVAFLKTPFARAHAARTHYNWFSTSFIYLETGYVGLLFFYGFYGLIYYCAARREKRGGNLLYCQIAKVMALCSVLLGIYNTSLRLESGYMVYFTLALPFLKTAEVPERAGNE